MWLLGFLVLRVVFVASDEFKINNYAVKIEKDTLMRVQANDRSAMELNLSGYGIRRIDKQAFDDAINIKILNMSNNFLVDFPASIFSKLTNLKHLSLANNKIRDLSKAFVGLDKLKSLDISNNPLGFLGAGDFAGLGGSVNIFTSGSPIHKMSTSIFEKNIGAARESKETIRNKRETRDLGKTFPIRICIEEGKLMFVESLKEKKNLTSNCVETIHEIDTFLTLNYLNITSFERGWYRVEEKSITEISLSNNKIEEVTSELLNDLPQNIKVVDLDENPIVLVKRGIIQNFNLDGLSLSKSSIRKIESGAFERMNLTYLFIDENHLTDVEFIATLPPSMVALTVRKNYITEIPDGCLLNLGKMEHLHFDGNYITEIRKNSLLGLSNVDNLGFEDNRIERIESGAFRKFSYLYNLFMRNNRLANLENGAFDGIKEIIYLDLDMNKFTDAARIRDGLPQHLEKLSLDDNEIQSLEFDSFVNAPRTELLLRGNKISKIAKGSLNLPKLTTLDLGNNLLNHVDGDAFKNSRSLERLSLDGNAITKIEKGFAKHMKSIIELDISRNPIERLENGALFGMAKDDTRQYVLMSATPIELIQGGHASRLYLIYESGNRYIRQRAGENAQLRRNAITTIAKGSFTVPKLYGLDVYFDMADLSKVFIPGLSHRFSGALFSRLSLLPVGREGIGLVDLSKDPIKRLENGSLTGIAMGRRNGVYLFETPIEFIHGDLFDNEQ